MTTQPAFVPHPCARLRPGDIVETHCSRAMERTDHLYQPQKFPPLLCLHCHPEQDPRRPQKESEK